MTDGPEGRGKLDPTLAFTSPKRCYISFVSHLRRGTCTRPSFSGPDGRKRCDCRRIFVCPAARSASAGAATRSYSNRSPTTGPGSTICPASSTTILSLLSMKTKASRNDRISTSGFRDALPAGYQCRHSAHEPNPYEHFASGPAAQHRGHSYLCDCNA